MKMRRFVVTIRANRDRLSIRRLVTGPIWSAGVVLLLIVTLVLPPSLGASPNQATYPAIRPAASSPTGEPTPAAPGGVCPDSASAPADWPVMVCDAFDSNPDNRWVTGIASDVNAISSRTIVDGNYRWQQKALKSFFAYVRYLDATLSDFFVAVDGRTVTGLQTAQYGLSFRQVDAQNYYVFQIRDQGQYRADVLIDNAWTTLIDWTDSPDIHGGEVNRLAVKGEGNTFTLYINDQKVTEVTDDKLAQGQVGLNTSLDAGQEALFEFDNFELRAPEGSAVMATPTAATVAPTLTRTPARRTPARATPAPRATATPIAPASKTPTAGGACDQDAAVAPQDWPLGLCDSFADNHYAWPVASSDVQYGKVTWEMNPGVYHWNIKATSGFYQSARPSINAITDFYESATIKRTSGPDTVNYGLQFRWVDSNNFYAFNVADTKNFIVYLLYRGQWQTLLDWTASDAIKPGEANLLAVKAEKSKLTFYINNEQVAEFNDTRLTNGLPGLAVSVDANQNTDVEFSSFEVRTSPSSVAVATLVVAPATVQATSTPTRTAARATSTATPRPSPTPRGGRKTPAATPTPAAPSALGCDADADIAPIDWNSSVCDTFDSDRGNWAVGPQNDEFAKLTRTIADGVYGWDVNGLKAGYLSARYGSATDKVTDGFVAVDARLTAGPEDVGFGLQTRKADADNFYVFVIANNGKFMTEVMVNNEWKTLTDWQASNAIVPGDWNRLAIQSEGSKFTFFINGTQVADADDSSVAAGQAGVAVNMDTPTQATVEFDNFSIWAP
jgi:hypothetical protein